MPTARDARNLDLADPLHSRREMFLLPEQIVYLDGNSLGALSSGVPATVEKVVRDQWGDHLITAWTEDDWWGAPLRIGDRIGRLLGAAPGQITVGESTSVQTFNALVAAARLRPGRRLLVTDPDHFPTNRYLAQSAAGLCGLEVVAVPVPDVCGFLREQGEQVAVVSYGAVDFRTGRLWDTAEVTAAAHAAGAVTVWDLCHAAGALPVALDDQGVDIAVGCTYKYLSGGPGSPAFIYVARRHHEIFEPPLTGWHGHARPFRMEQDFEPAPGIARTRIGTPPVLSLLALEAALGVFDGVEMTEIRAKSLSLGDFFIACFDQHLASLGFELMTPREGSRRGSQVTVAHPEAHALMRALIARGVVGDVRPPDMLRFGFNALYVSHSDIHRAVTTLRDIALCGAHHDPRFTTPTLIT
ncbi:kynureninase [Streptomyces thermospinosisporus]|uniref:Kynureninase n=1 Tax=Streptomyces thermospinosisporus TaxID=161482 RepID=A0ABN1YS70_9ACTN